MSCQLYKDEPKIFHLNVKNFKTVKQSNKTWIVQFYLQTCPHSVAFAPVFTNVAAATSATLSIGVIDCNLERQLCDNFAIELVPDIKIIHGHTVMNYVGERTVKKIVKAAETAQKSIIKLQKKSTQRN